MQEQKRVNPRTVNMTTTMEVPIAKGTIEYIAGVNPVESWAPVLVEGMDDKGQREIAQKNLEIVKAAEQTKEYHEKLHDFMQETVKLFQAVTKRDADALRPYTAGKKFNFVLGMPRTGGTTVYNAMSSAYGWPWERLLLSMTHNSMPNAIFIQQNPFSEFDMGWRLPWNFNNALFELCQFLVYVNREAQDCENVFLKSSALSFGVKLLNFLFGNQARYIVTVRHPGAITLTSGLEGEVTREKHMETMSMWGNLYSSIVRDCRPLGEIIVVEYGEKMTGFINKVFEKTRYGSRAEETSFFEFEDYDKEFYDSDSVRKVFEYVKNSWKLFDLDFPIPDKCI